MVVGRSCGSWLASDDITAVCLNDRGASGSRASSLLQGFVVAGGNLVGAGLPAMTSLRFGGTTETPMAREQARSYRDLWWPAVILWELPCQRWHHCGLSERARCQWIASKLAPTGICGGRRQSCGSWLASDGISAVWLNDRDANGSRASSLLQEFVVVGRSCGSWLASDGISAVCMNDRGASGSRASSLLPEFVVAGGNLVGAGLPAMTSLRSG